MNNEKHIYLNNLLQSLQDKTSLATIENQELLSKIRDKNIIVYFYPKDSTPGCTTEGKDFTTNHAKFKDHDTEIIGISRDSIESHQKFKTKYNFPFELISDSNSIICEAFNVIGKINLLGIERATFLFNKQGSLVHEWRKVKVKEHVNDVLSQVIIIDK